MNHYKKSLSLFFCLNQLHHLIYIQKILRSFFDYTLKHVHHLLSLTSLFSENTSCSVHTFEGIFGLIAAEERLIREYWSVTGLSNDSSFS